MGTYGVGEQSIEDLKMNLINNLYKIWNSMSSCRYFSKLVNAEVIPKKNGGTHILGILTVEDRIAEMVAKCTLNLALSRYFIMIPMEIDRIN